MTASDPVVPVDVLRHAIRARAEETSLRVVAAETGMSFAWVRDFLGGVTPYPATVRKLSAWYLRSRVADGALGDVGTVRAALAVFLDPVAPKAREGARRAFLDALERIYKDAGGKAPGWLREVRND